MYHHEDDCTQALTQHTKLLPLLSISTKPNTNRIGHSYSSDVTCLMFLSSSSSRLSLDAMAAAELFVVSALAALRRARFGSCTAAATTKKCYSHGTTARQFAVHIIIGSVWELRH
jgi:hypothetical protein